MNLTANFEGAVDQVVDGSSVYKKARTLEDALFNNNRSLSGSVCRRFEDDLFNRRRQNAIVYDGQKVSAGVLQAMKEVHNMSQSRARSTYLRLWKEKPEELWEYMPVTMRHRLENRLKVAYYYTELLEAKFARWRFWDSNHTHSVISLLGAEQFTIESVDATGLPDGEYDTRYGSFEVRSSEVRFSERRPRGKKADFVISGTRKIPVKMVSVFDMVLDGIKTHFDRCEFGILMKSVLETEAYYQRLPHFAEGFFLAAQRMLEIRQGLDVSEAVRTAREYVGIDYNLSNKLRKAKDVSNFKVSIDCEDDRECTPTVPLKLQITERTGASALRFAENSDINRRAIFIMTPAGSFDDIETVYGAVHSDGSCWFTPLAVQHRVLTFLQKWNDECVDGVFFDWLFGVSKGTCIFCNRPLSQEISKAQGSGAVCRSKYLPLWLRLKDHIGYTVDKTKTHIAGLAVPAVRRSFVAYGEHVPEKMMELLQSKSETLQQLLEDDGDFDLAGWLDSFLLTTDGLKRAFTEVCSLVRKDTWFVVSYYFPPETVALHDLVFVLDYLGLDDYIKAVLRSPRVAWMIQYTHLQGILKQDLRY